MEQGGAAPVIRVENLRKEYVTYQRGSSLAETVKSLFVRKKLVVRAVDDISFSIFPGEILGLLGENGAGKSTTIKMLSGVLFPTSGRVEVLGFSPFAQRKKYVAHIGAVFGQKSQLIWDIPPLDSFALNKAIYAIPAGDYSARLDMMVGRLGLEGVVKKPTRVLSLGERMKCEFVMAMLHGPRVVFLDEPTIGVDILAKETIRDFVRQMNREGVTFILTTHDLEDIEQLAHRAIIINHGKIVLEDSLDGLRHYLGDKKAVRLAFIQKAGAQRPGLSALAAHPGVELLEQGEAHAALLVDNALLPMADFIGRLSGLEGVADISIKEMGIDAILKAVYKSDAPRQGGAEG